MISGRSLIYSVGFIVILGSVTFGLDAFDAIKQWRQNYGDLNSIEVQCVRTVVKAEPNDHPLARNLPPLTEISIIRKDKMFRSTAFLSWLSGKTISTEASYDGLTRRFYTKELKEGTIDEQTPDPTWQGYKFSYIDEYVGSIFVPEFERFAKTGNFEIVSDSKQIKGFDCIGYRLMFKEEIVFEIWFAKDKGMLPILYHNPGPDSERYEILEVAQENGTWYPKKARQSFTNNDAYFEFQLDINKFVLDPTTDASTFSLDFPSGTEVYDERIRESYEVGVP